ncbi:MAG: phage portal protein [Ferrimicrobium sp.]
MSTNVNLVDPAAIPSPSQAGVVSAGQLVSTSSALSLTAVYACVRILAESIANLDRELFRDEKGTKKKILPTSIVTDPFYGLRPHEGYSQVMVSLLLRGNAYLHVVAREWTGYPKQVEILSPDLVRVTIEHGQPLYRIGNKVVPNEDILHIRGLMLPGSVMGVSPVDYAARDFGIALAVAEYGARFFSQGATLSGILSSDNDLSTEQLQRIAQQFATRHGGAGNAHLPLVLSSSMKFQPLQVTPEQAQFLLTREFEDGEIATWFGVPPHLIGHTTKSTSWGQGIEQQNLAFKTYTLTAWMHRIEEAWSDMLPHVQRMRFNADSLLRADILSRYQAYMIGRQVGFLNNDEVRSHEDLEPIPGDFGTNYQAPLNAPTPLQGALIKGTDDGSAPAAPINPVKS